MVLTQGGQVTTRSGGNAGLGTIPTRQTVFFNPATEGQIILNSEGSGNPGTAPTGLRKTSRVYYRKADLTDGAELKASFGDVNVGNSASCTVQGGPFKSIFYSTYNIPSKPKYGDANLVGLYAGVPVTNVERKTLSSLPNFNIWKGKETGITDGSCTVDETPIAAFMSHIDVAPNVYEGFDGGAGAVTGTTRRIGNRVVSHMDEYLPADWAWNNMQLGTRQGLDSYQDFLDRYCIQVDGVISGYACPVEQTSFSLLVTAGTILSPSRWGEVGNGVTTTYKPTLGRSATDLIEPVWDTISVHNAGYPLTEFTETVSEDVESTSDVNSNNSLFHVYSNNINAAAADDAPIFEASVKFSGEKVLSGAYSAKMRTYWSNSSISIGNMPDPKDSGATNRQEVMMQYGPLPCPTVLDMESSGQNETAYRISFDLYIDKLAAAWSGGSGVGQDRLTRGFVVTLSDTQYTRDNGTLYDWIKEKDNDDSEFAYFALLNSSQDSANAADADHSLYIVGSNQYHLADSNSNFDEDATNKMIRLNAVDPFETAGLNHTQATGLPAGQWIHFDIATIPYLYGYRLRATTPTPNGSENVLSAFQLRTTDNSRQSDPANWTPYIQFWLVNYPSDHSNDNAYAAAQDVESVVFMDNFQISNANYTLENATICEENISTKSKLTFGTNKARDETNGTHDSARILSLGFQEVDDFPDGTLKNLMFSTFSSTDINDTGTLHPSYAKMAWSAYSTANASHLKLGWPMGNDSNGENDVDATYAFTDGTSPQIGLTLGGTIGSLAPDAGSGTEVAWTGATAVEGFSQKGLLQVSFDDSTYANFTKTRRENHFVKARVLKIVEQSSGQTQFLVDNPEIFRLPSTQHTGYVTTYRLYLHNENYKTDGNPNTSMRDMTLKSIEGNLVTLKGNSLVDAGGTDLAITANLSQLCISPVMYWLCMYYKWHDNTDNMPDRYYNSVHNVNSGVAAGISSGNYGATWNEHKFTDAATYDNGWTWGKSETSNLVISTDYGFGAYDTETKQGGYCGKFNPSAVSPTGSATTGTRFNIVDVSGIVTVDDTQPESTIALAITPEEDLLEHKMTIDTDEASAGQRPFVLAAFMDNVAPPPQLSVIPYENDPTKYEFQWSASGKDYWYGFIIIDKEPILNKYHKVGMHIPNFFTLANYDGNVDYASGTSSGLKYYNYPENQERDLELDSTFSIDFEGICGLTPKFDGDAYIRADADHMEIEDPGSPAPPTTNATFMAHVRISELPSSGTDEIVTISDNSGNVAFELEIGTTGILTATVAPGSGTAVALTSTKQLVADNESPTSVIVTLDTEIDSGNVKLFIDGRLEDQSGLRTAAGSANNWKTGESLDDPSNGYVYLGNNDSNDGFHGTIEEFVVSHRTFYPVVVSDGSFVLDKALKDLIADSSGISQSYSARLFLCDYHNISGKTASEISMSAPVSMRKTAFRVRGD